MGWKSSVVQLQPHRRAGGSLVVPLLCEQHAAEIDHVTRSLVERNTPGGYCMKISEEDAAVMELARWMWRMRKWRQVEFRQTENTWFLEASFATSLARSMMFRWCRHSVRDHLHVWLNTEWSLPTTTVCSVCEKDD